MKKLFISALAVGMLTACSQEETLSTQAPTQISFAGAFVENASRAIDPSFHNVNNPLKAFDVWGFMDTPSGIVFNHEDVTYDGTNWKTATLQYWAPEHDYYFAAMAPMNSTNWNVDINQANEYGIGYVSFTNIDGTEDLIYASATATTKNITIDANNPGKVALTFNHLLSKVKFSFTNTFPNDNASIKITNIKMTAPKTAGIDLNQDKWWEGQKWSLGTEQTTLAFGDMENDKVASKESSESQYERLTFPSTNTEYVVTFDVELYYGTALAYSNSLQTTISGVKLEMGKAYNFHANIDASNIVPGDGEGDKLFPIEFTATVKDWEDGKGYEGGTINTGSLPVLEGDNATIAAGTTKTLDQSAVIATSYKVAGTLDGNGNTLFSAEAPANNGLVCPEGTATVKNVTIDGENRSTTDGKSLRAIYITKAGTYTIDNVKTEDVTYAINVNTKQAVVLNVSNSTLQGWTSYGSSTTASFKNTSFTCGTYAYFRPYGNTTLEDCNFEDGFVIDFSQLVSNNTTITFKNCKYNGTLITAENINTLKSSATEPVAFIENYNADVVVF